ncbi:AzlC family ABC transporter permease [Pseudorhodoferax sp.]|uniref:AzlC family ABC transporter permease n=1 Tax=Pseudorhodoferax sp. TaxID=1993553 RepID=UPI002DD61C3F|nr:AzlC family ABC transporter permease [Pseudorhodoferax sp.]
MQHIEYRRGAREMAAPVLGMAAWGLVTGVAMVKSGLTVAQALAMTLFVFAGSAQLASLPLIAAGAPLWVLLLTAFCVNLRFVIFSAQWQPYFGHLPLRQRLLMMYVAGDVTYVNFLRRYPEARAQPGQIEYYWGAVHVNWLGWQSASVLGVLAADAVPTHWGLGFAGVLALLGLAYSLMNERVLLWVALVAGAVSIATYHLPLRLNIVCAIAVAGALGWWLDRRHG